MDLIEKLEERVGGVSRGWHVQARDDAGVVHALGFPGGVSPTDQQIIDRLPRHPRLVPTRKADIEDYVNGLYQVWQRWRTTQLEATRRGLAAQIITALTNKENSSWDEYLQALNAWRTAN